MADFPAYDFGARRLPFSGQRAGSRRQQPSRACSHWSGRAARSSWRRPALFAQAAHAHGGARDREPPLCRSRLPVLAARGRDGQC
eukprot:15475754-Alexandrium_andersonii.AAC.1